MSAIVRLLSCMEPHVGFQMVVPGEPLMTDPALERFFSSVGALVILQHVLVPERPVANLAGEHLGIERYL